MTPTQKRTIPPTQRENATAFRSQIAIDGIEIYHRWFFFAKPLAYENNKLAKIKKVTLFVLSCCRRKNPPPGQKIQKNKKGTNQCHYFNQFSYVLYVIYKFQLLTQKNCKFIYFFFYRELNFRCFWHNNCAIKKKKNSRILLATPFPRINFCDQDFILQHQYQ